ncbi:MAG: SpoIIIAH-like family protein [Clostridia bacterium]|nr:SpoIIIAH-like family protein [Clostridia bacterium]
MFVIHKKNILVGVLGATLVMAGVINYTNQSNVEVSGDLTSTLGESTYVSGMVDNLEGNRLEELADAYFVSARLERDKTYGEKLEVQENILYNEKSDESMKKAAQEEINCISDNLTKEMSIETLLKAKGFEDTIALINEPNVNVVVKSMEELNVAQVAQIQNIVMREANAKPENIHIVTKR